MGKTATQTLRILEIDPWLKPFEHDLQLRLERYESLKKVLLGNFSNFSEFANGHLYFGIQRTKTGWVYREWAPAARALYLTGEFNNWHKTSHPLTRINNGCWEINLEYEKYKKTFLHGSLIKVRVVTDNGAQDRIPIYIRRVVQDQKTKDFSGQLWFPEEFRWTDILFKPKQAEPIIYEAHIGMAQETEAVGTYREFADEILPRIIKGGYNTIQLMAILEHPYYGSFGYQVSNFFAPSSRFGTPEDLKYLINKAHLSGITVLLDLVHSHAVKNIAEGINEFDGTAYQFFHDGPKGEHPGWDSKLFNYGKPEVLHFLLSNIKYWLTEFHFDGFRFDGVTSMLYHHHGLCTAFDNYAKYFSMDTDIDAVTYLQFATALTHELKPTAITIAEDMSGMPGMCLPITDGGIGFDYRLGMGIPDHWIKTLKHQRDEDWDLWGLWHELVSRRPQEKVIGYAESHDQALVGDKTLAFWLMDKEMYWHMQKDDQDLIIERGIALHKLIRLVTSTLGGNGYLNFIGNEFGHPEWVDFPRSGNNWSYKYARRQWSLVDNQQLKYQYLNAFDRGMLKLLKKHHILSATDTHNLWIDQEQKLLMYRKAGLIFAFNLHPGNSYPQIQIPTGIAGKYKVIFDTDDLEAGGQGRIKHTNYTTDKAGNITLYLPCRTAVVLERF